MQPLGGGLQNIYFVLIRVAVEINIRLLALVKATFEHFSHDKVLKQMAAHGVECQIFGLFYAKQGTCQPRVAEIYFGRFDKPFSCILVVRRH